MVVNVRKVLRIEIRTIHCKSTTAARACVILKGIILEVSVGVRDGFWQEITSTCLHNFCNGCEMEGHVVSKCKTNGVFTIIHVGNSSALPFIPCLEVGSEFLSLGK